MLRLRSKSAVSSRQAPMSRVSLQGGRSRKGQSTLSEAQNQADAVLSMQLVGANPKVTMGGAGDLPGKTNYFIGSDPQKWRTHVPTYAGVKYSNVYPGVDLVYYGNQSGQLEYDFVVAPGADPSAIVLSVAPGVQNKGQNSRIGNSSSTGETALRIAPDGDLIVHLRMVTCGCTSRWYTKRAVQPSAFCKKPPRGRECGRRRPGPGPWLTVIMSSRQVTKSVLLLVLTTAPNRFALTRSFTIRLTWVGPFPTPATASP